MAVPIRIAHRPTFKYSRFVWDGNTFDVPDALISATPETSPVVGSAIAASGRRQTVYEHTETAITIVTPIMDAVATDQLERFFREWGQQGNQFEYYLDTHLRAYWGFQQHLKDNNLDNPLRIQDGYGIEQSDTPAYVALTLGYAVTVPTATKRALQASLISARNADNTFVSATASEGGIAALLFKPTWAQTDSAEHYLLDMAIPGSLSGNRIRIVKQADNKTVLLYTGASGGQIVVASTTGWAANDEVTILAQWGGVNEFGALVTLDLSVQGVTISTRTYTKTYGGGKLYGTGLKYGDTSGAPSGSEGTITAALTRATLGIDDLILCGRLVGSVGLFTLYRGLYGTLDNVLGSFRYPWRTYYPLAELADPAFRAVRFTPSRELFTYQLRIRDGV